MELSAESVHRLCESQGLGEPHLFFAGGARYYPISVRQEADAHLRRELDAAGVNGPRGLDPDFVDLLTAVQRGQAEYYGWLQDEEGPYSVIAAQLGRVGVLAQKIGDRVTFERVDPARVLDAFIFRLPNVPASRGDAISVRESDYAADSQQQGGFQMSRPRSARPPEARRLEALMSAPRKGGGKLYTARRDHRGVRTRAAEWLNFLDLPDGRWTVYRTSGRGERSISAVPGTPQFIRKRMVELHSTI
ncbi:ESX secretion-associated protein EspG [Actinokineospora pegani]|uniref:ESX secretion-associated protein EspG n=1 Tax=Actinokineospora pegani TaxID=2654637 RepID=UPI0022A7CA95|nr:ESX secretion-associated protein EspG [Actinokineospora pegani]